MPRERGKIVAVVLVLTVTVGAVGVMLTQSNGPAADTGVQKDSASTTSESPDGTAAPAAETGSADEGTVSQMQAAGELVTPERDVEAGETVELAGADTSEGDDLSYSWTQTDGPSVSLEQNDGARASFDAPEVDTSTTLTFRLTVSNGEETDSTTVTVTVEPTNQNRAPSADAGDDRTTEGGQTVDLAGTATDPDGDSVTVEWRQTSGPSAELTGKDTANPGVTVPEVEEPTTLSFELSASDGQTTATDTVTLTVEPSNQAPTVSAGSNVSVREGHGAALNASATTDPDGDDLTYSWNQTSGRTVDLHDADTATPWFDAHRTAGDETLTFELTVSDGQTNVTDTVTVTIEETDSVPEQQEPANGAPTADAGDDVSVEAGTSVELAGSNSSDPDGDTLTYTWAQTSGPEVTLETGDASGASFAAPDVTEATTLTFELTVADGNGGTDTDTVTVQVEPAESSTQTYSRDEISKAKYYLYFDELSDESAVHIEEFYLRQPFTGDMQPGDVQTRGELAEARYGMAFDELGRDQALTVQRTFDAQFGDTGGDATDSLDELSEAVFGANFSAIDNESAVQIQELYDRQPFADGVSPETVRTRDEIAQEEFGTALSALSNADRLEVERLYDAQFVDEEEND
ncbi:PKD domain-containing protein [Haloarchaeobius sp. DT45]|uniref:PKD domain-containing protein n=1 Tax=Haloarchaeobius sp. DT45 TaxID=3446116 RepID=UPI003F6CADAE